MSSPAAEWNADQTLAHFLATESDRWRAYQAGRGTGPPPSRRFEVLTATGPDLLTAAVVELHRELVRGRGPDGAWNELCRRLQLDLLESAFLLGLVHDAEPSFPVR